jgi:hypothetical protein
MLGNTFAASFRAQFDTTTNAINAMIAAANKYRALTGQAPLDSITIPAGAPSARAGSTNIGGRVNVLGSQDDRIVSRASGGVNLVGSQLDRLASGGLVSGPTLAMIGEGSTGAEVAIPVRREILNLLGAGRSARRGSGRVSSLPARTARGVRGDGRRHGGRRLGLALAGRDRESVLHEAAGRPVRVPQAFPLRRGGGVRLLSR